MSLPVSPALLTEYVWSFAHLIVKNDISFVFNVHISLIMSKVEHLIMFKGHLYFLFYQLCKCFAYFSLVLLIIFLSLLRILYILEGILYILALFL